MEVAVQAVPATNESAVQATTGGDDPPGQAGQPQHRPHHHTAEASKPDKYVRDEFCPDRLFQSSLSLRAQMEIEREEDLENFKKMIQHTVKEKVNSFK